VKVYNITDIALGGAVKPRLLSFHVGGFIFPPGSEGDIPEKHRSYINQFLLNKGLAALELPAEYVEKRKGRKFLRAYPIPTPEPEEVVEEGVVSEPEPPIEPEPILDVGWEEEPVDEEV
jgi:hypothetical protein